MTALTAESVTAAPPSKSLADLQLSVLRGSVKQCAWANAIREQKLTELVAVVNGTIQSKRQWDERIVENGIESFGFMDGMVAKEKRALDLLTKIESASFWIDHRDAKVRHLFPHLAAAPDLIGAGDKLLRDAAKLPAELDGYGHEDLLKYVGRDYRLWLTEQNFDLDEIRTAALR